ncbi:MAG: hypothetical protein WCD45_08705 [Gallionella sp.]
MFEYIFFDAALRDKFVNYAEQRSVPCSASEDEMGMVVSVPEDLPDEVADALEQYYDTLDTEQAELSQANGDLKRLAGFRFNLPDGQSRLLPVDTGLANRLMATFSLAEIQELFEAVAHCTLHPNEDRLCKIIAAQTAAERG